MLLLAGVTRGERRSIVEEVELQIYELLSRKTEGEPGRADIIAVLAKLDPPEAYAPEPYRQRIRDNSAPKVVRMRRPQPSLLALASAASALMVGFLTLPLAYVVIQSGLNEWTLMFTGLLIPAGLAITGCGLTAIVRIRRADGWLFGLRAALFAAVLFPLLFGNGVLVMTCIMFDLLGVFLVVGLILLVCNGGLVYHVWKLVASDYRRATPEAM
ncbi:hypothetical protein BH10PLA2_BH10PLA2_10570 [soil metagenome]